MSYVEASDFVGSCNGSPKHTQTHRKSIWFLNQTSHRSEN